MVWTVPMTFVSGTTLTSSQLNTFLRDNMNETSPAKATTPGYHFVSVGENQIAERAWANDFVATNESTASTDFTDLDTIGPALTVETSSVAMWIVTASLSNDETDNFSAMSIEVTGATSISPDLDKGLWTDGNPANQTNRASSVHLETSLTPGTNTFTAKYRSGVGTGSSSFARRELVVIAL